MSDDVWIVVPNWDKFQHYHDRSPVWIKVYTELNSNPDWLELSFSDRGVLVSIWLEYAASRGVLRSRDAAKRIGLPSHYAHFSRHIKSLNDAGFIRLVASKPLALTRSREEEEEKKKNTPAANARKRTPRDPSAQYSNVTPKNPVKAIETMIRNGVITDPVDLEAELAGAKLNSTHADQLRKLLP